jgi:hypothetical protein
MLPKSCKTDSTTHERREGDLPVSDIIQNGVGSLTWTYMIPLTIFRTG